MGILPPSYAVCPTTPLLDGKLHNRMSVLPECLAYSFKKFSLPGILSRVTQNHPALR
jgi:hypothetical protein